jgi:hypothetical protein
MTADNFEQVLAGLIQRAPFQVFTVELHGGYRFEVDHPRAIVVRDGVAVFLAPGGVPVWFDHESVNQIIGASSKTQL